MRTIRFNISITPDQLLKYYRGQARNVVTTDSKGMSITFPVEVIRPFVTQSGVSGSFEMTVDENNKFIDIKKVAG